MLIFWLFIALIVGWLVFVGIYNLAAKSADKNDESLFTGDDE